MRCPMFRFQDDHRPVITEIITIDEPSGSDWTFPLHQHRENLEVSYIVQGCVDCYFESITKRLQAGDVLIKNAGVIHAETMIEGSPLREICISFDGVHLTDGLPNHLISDDLPPVFHVEGGSLLRELFLHLASDQGELPALVKEDAARFLISLLCHLVSTAELKEHHTKGNSDLTIQKIKEYLDQNYAQKISLDDLGEMFFISPFYLSRQFKKFTGYTVKQYILNLQMGEAENLLVFSDLSIKEIALRCGYENLQYFYVQFKRFAQCTPVEYRRKYRQEQETE